MGFIEYFIMLFIIFWIINVFVFEKEAPNVSNAAIIMAIGIFLVGAAHQFPLLSERLDKVFAASLSVIAILMASSFTKAVIDGQFTQMKDFAMGTWVAGMSVLGDVMLQQGSEFRAISLMIALFSSGLWVFYLTIVIPRLKELYKTNLYEKQIHGTLLLTTVSTQSVILLFSSIFRAELPLLFSQSMIYLGIVFYVLGILLIFRRYKSIKKWKLADDWPATNCIIHGALSITGLTAVTSGAMGEGFVLTVWLLALGLFIVVEAIEGCRLVARVKSYGMKKAIGCYSSSQWSRNFTFGMFYAFTMRIDVPLTRFLQSIRELVLTKFAWIVLFLLINEILLYFQARVNWKIPTRDHKKTRSIGG